MIRKIDGMWFVGIAAALTMYLCAFALEIAPGARWYYERRYLRELLGCRTSFPPMEVAIDTPRSFNGDGFSVARYPLSPKIRECITALEDGQQTLPTRMRHRDAWSTRHWKQPPLSPLESSLVRWALSAEGKELVDEMRVSLTRNTTWFAILYKGKGTDANPNEYIMNVDLIVADPVTGKLYILNSNT